MSLDVYRAEIEKRKRSDSWVVHELVPGETIQRSYTVTTYEAYARTKPPRKFEHIPEMKRLLRKYPHARTEWALIHLENAENEDLPLEVRTQHFDIAGVHIVQPRIEFGMPMVAHPAFAYWRNGNGA